MTSKAKRPSKLYYYRNGAMDVLSNDLSMKLNLVDVSTVIDRMSILCPRYELRHVTDVLLCAHDARGKALYRNGLMLGYSFKDYAENCPPNIQVIIPEFATKNDRAGHFVEISLAPRRRISLRQTTMVSLKDEEHPAWSFNRAISRILLDCHPKTYHGAVPVNRS